MWGPVHDVLMWGLKCVWGAWHGMWVMGMSHEVCADMCIQCLVAVVGHAWLYTELQGLHKAMWGPVTQ